MGPFLTLRCKEFLFLLLKIEYSRISLFVCPALLTFGFLTEMTSGWGIPEKIKEKKKGKGKLNTDLVVHWILVFFPKLLVAILFSESSNS